MAIGSGTGTQATIPYSVTAANLIANAIRPALDDISETEFTDTELLAFLNEAISEYTQHFPRLTTTTITTITNTRVYPLPFDARSIISVEFPSGAYPPTYIPRIDHHRITFSHTDCYDLLPTNELTAAPNILFSFYPTPGGIITISLQQEHDHRLTLNDDITVPSDHHHILIQYVLFATTRQQQAREESNPTSANSLLMAQYASNTRRYELMYLNAINRVIFHRRGQSRTAAWKMDD